MSIDEEIKDLQQTADMLNIDYAASVLYGVYSTQYQLFKKSESSVRQSDYAFECMNCLLEILNRHYGKGGGGRWKGHHF